MLTGYVTGAGSGGTAGVRGPGGGRLCLQRVPGLAGKWAGATVLRRPGCRTQPLTALHPPGANPCEHKGKCINTLGSFECQCLQGYSGPRCEIDVNECVSNPCQNDATCLDQIGEFQCICMPGTETEAGQTPPGRVPQPPCPLGRSLR